MAFADSRINFPCKTLTPSPTVPTSGISFSFRSHDMHFMTCSRVVHALRVADIQHIAAIGDSLTVRLLISPTKEV